MSTLDELAKKYGTDKQSSCHGYTKYYEQHFEPIRNAGINVLEIGVHKGFSLQMWGDYFPNAHIWGIDDGSSGDLQTQYDNPRIHFMQGSQIDVSFLNRVIADANSFDIIMDDGSHYSSDIVFTLTNLFSICLNSGGYYVIEDLHCSYPPYTSPGLAERFNKNNLTAIDFLKTLVDEVNRQNTIIESVEFYKSMCFIKKK